MGEGYANFVVRYGLGERRFKYCLILYDVIFELPLTSTKRAFQWLQNNLLIKFPVKCDFWRVFQSDMLFICSKSLYKIRNKFFSGTQLKEVTFESTNFIWSNMFSNFEWLFSACLFDHWVWLYLLKWNSGNRNNYLSFSKYW